MAGCGDMGVKREDISKAHITYFYDEDVGFPHMLAASIAPAGTGSIQAESGENAAERVLTNRAASVAAA
jgi:hypothetical protein